MKKLLLILTLIAAGNTVRAQDPPPHEQCNTCWMDAECYWCHLSTFDGGRVCLDCSGVMGMTSVRVSKELTKRLTPEKLRMAKTRGLTSRGLETMLLNAAFEMLAPRKKNVQGHSSDAYLEYVKRPCGLDLSKPIILAVAR